MDEPKFSDTGRPLRLIDNDHIAMITVANIPHTITNALMICFGSEMDITSVGARWVKYMRAHIERHKT